MFEVSKRRGGRTINMIPGMMYVARVWLDGYTDTRGIFGERNELIEVSGTGIDVLSNLP